MKSGHINTLYRHFFSNRCVQPYQREALVLQEGCSLFLDWFHACPQASKPLLLFTHGLESSSFSPDIQQTLAMAKQLGFDVLAYNCRNCAVGESLQADAFYHSGLSSDLAQVVNFAIAKGYQQIILLGLSMGGNITLKYLGEQAEQLPKAIKAALVFSAPLDLSASAKQLLRFPACLYAKHFLRLLKAKVSQLKHPLESQGVAVHKVLGSKTLQQFDEHLVAKIHGFKNAEDYYQKSSSLGLLAAIAVPTVIINAQNDPMLSASCYPSVDNAYVHTYYPKHGGHLGFYQKHGHYLSDCLQQLSLSVLH